MPAAEREHEIVLFGATGFTGALTAEYLVANAPPGLRWALAGRNREKLEGVRDRVGAGDVPLLQADVTDADSLRAVAESTKVVITTVGPYINFGEPLVAACAAAGTDYVDLTGEPLFVDQMWLRHHEAAERSGARIVHSCGFDSIPYDLGVLFTVGHLPRDVPISVEGFVRAGGTFSGGTYASAVEAMGRLRESMRVAGERRRQEGRPQGRKVHGTRGTPHREDGLGWVVPFPTIDPQTVLRSARALERYGPDFSYAHYLVAKRLPVLAGLAAGAGTVIALAQLPPMRGALLKLAKQPGEGPSPEQREKGWFKVRFVAQGGGQRVETEVSGGDPGYGETSKMLGESALCLARDELPASAGQLTPAVAMGEKLIERLQRAGIEFRVT